MASLSQILESNARISSNLPKHLVAVFAGATTGIGEATLVKFVQYAAEPRIYLFARNPASAEQVIAKCRQLNPRGEYELIKVDLSSVKETDLACEQVKKKEKHVNLVVLSAGEIILDRKLTPEGLNVFLAASTYTRIRIAQQLLPLLEAAARTTPLARVVNVAGGTKEGNIDISDLAAMKMSLTSVRPHLTSMHTLALEHLALQSPTVSFVHDFPGAVYTALHKDTTGLLAFVFRCLIDAAYMLLGTWLFVPIGESGERHVFLATSASFPPREGTAAGISADGLPAVKGSNGEQKSGVYSVDWDCQGPGASAETALKALRKKGVQDLVWNHFLEKFEKATK